MDKIIGVAIALILFFCLFKMPYGYYQFVRIIVCAGFAILAWMENDKERIPTAILFLGCAILFNPIFKITFKRATWNTIDIIIAICLVIWLVVDSLTNHHSRRNSSF